MSLFWVVGFVPIFMGFFSCVRTMVNPEPASVPVVFQSMFRDCEQSDGEATLRITAVDQTAFSASLVWNFRPQHVADIQMNSPLGDTLLEISGRGIHWTTKGPRSFTITETKSGVVAIDGYDLPLHSDELSCVIAGFWPAQWLSVLHISEQRGRYLRMVGHDDLREIDVALTLLNAGESPRLGDIKSCAVLKWGGFLGFFRKEGVLCRERIVDGVVMRLDGVGRYKVEWTIQDEA